jgi:hypothetical protein
MDIPRTPDEITPEWLRAAIDNSFPNATFSSLKHERIGEDFGFVSRIYRCRWQDGDEPRSVVVKLWEPDGGAGVGEARFYQSFPDVGVRIPACYFNEFDEENNAAVLVLEDIQNAVQGDVLRLVDSAQAEGIANSLAAMHAKWMGSPKFEKYNWMVDVSHWRPEEGWFESRRALFRERFPDRLSSLASETLDHIEAAPWIANSRLQAAPRTLSHGDFHLDNILFESSGQPVFLDWTRPAIGRVAQNLAELLFKMIPLKLFDTTLNAYRGEFNRVSTRPTTMRALESQLSGAFLRQFSASTCGMARWQPTLPRAIKIIDENLRKTNEVVEFWQTRHPKLFSFLSRSN